MPALAGISVHHLGVYIFFAIIDPPHPLPTSTSSSSCTRRISEGSGRNRELMDAMRQEYWSATGWVPLWTFTFTVPGRYNLIRSSINRAVLPAQEYRMRSKTPPSTTDRITSTTRRTAFACENVGTTSCGRKVGRTRTVDTDWPIPQPTSSTALPVVAGAGADVGGRVADRAIEPEQTGRDHLHRGPAPHGSEWPLCTTRCDAEGLCAAELLPVCPTQRGVNDSAVF